MSDEGVSTGPDPVDVAVGHRIRLRRKWLRLSQPRLAEQVGLSFQQIQKYERGANRISASVLVRIARALDVRVSELFAEAFEPARETHVFEQLGFPGVVELIDAYVTIERSDQRSAILDLARDLAFGATDSHAPDAVEQVGSNIKTGPR